MSKEAILEDLRTALIDQDEDGVEKAVKKAIDESVDPVEIMNDGLAPALTEVGELFSREEMFLPDLIYTADIAMDVVKQLEELLSADASSMEKRGKILFCTVAGDVHDIGRKLCSMLMSAFGYEVIDGGVDVPSEEILRQAKEYEPDIVALSALLTTTMPSMIEFIELAKEAGVRENFKVMVGGAPVSREWAEKIGADGFSEDAATSVVEADRLLGIAS